MLSTKNKAAIKIVIKIKGANPKTKLIKNNPAK
jgi:hypothetical protein